MKLTIFCWLVPLIGKVPLCTIEVFWPLTNPKLSGEKLNRFSGNGGSRIYKSNPPKTLTDNHPSSDFPFNQTAASVCTKDVIRLTYPPVMSYQATCDKKKSYLNGYTLLRPTYYPPHLELVIR